jgi:hypothetical protein
MEEVAGLALAVGTRYNYFHSKNDLLLAIVRRESDRLPSQDTAFALELLLFAASAPN